MITKLGKEKLEQDIISLKVELERTYSERNKAAAEGDLKENSAYIFMGERAQVLHSQIEQAEVDLKGCIIQSTPTQTDFIAFGHEISLRFENDKRDMTITLVGKNDARLKSSWISLESPLGIALLGKRKLEAVSVNGQSVTILDISVGKI